LCTAAHGLAACRRAATLSSYDNQKQAHAWPQNDLRERTRLLADQTILIVGYGSIGRRLAELLAPYAVHVIGYRRSPQAKSSIRVVGPEQLSAAMGEADHVINILPQSAETQSLFDAGRFGQIKPGARYYTIGRGSTTDQNALLACLASGHLSAAYLDVTTPEPLPSDHPFGLPQTASSLRIRAADMRTKRCGSSNTSSITFNVSSVARH